jgi:hypothetical protein
LAVRHWDGAFPAQPGDFFFNSEFEFAAKNGRGLRRVYDHGVTIKADGSARVVTKMTVTNTEPADAVNNAAGSLGYMTIYGPDGAVLDESGSDYFAVSEAPMAGHPATGWFRAAAPSGGQTTLTVVWNVPGVVKQQPDGSWRYDLRWLHLPDHVGDVVNLTVAIPPGWRWTGDAPPRQFSLDSEFRGSWLLSGR